MCGVSVVLCKCSNSSNSNSSNNSILLLLQSLASLQNRGYDSFGMSCIMNDKLLVHKKA